MFYDRKSGVQSRFPLPLKDLTRVKAQCQTYDDELRWAVAIVADTGMRLAEACGLLVEDLRVDADIPRVLIRPHPWQLLKTEASQRAIPLVGAFLLAAKRLIENKTSDLAFPRYCCSIH